MSKMKRFSFLLLALALVIGVLAACSGGNNNDGNNDNSQPPAQQQQQGGDNSGNDAAEPEPEPIVYPDLGGRTIKFAAWWDDFPPNPDTFEGQEKIERVKQAEQNYNVTIEWDIYSWGDMNQTFINSVLDGQPFADLTRFQYDWAMPAALNGQLQKFGDLWDPTYHTVLQPAPLLLNEEYGFTGFDPTDASGVFFNRTLIEELGLKSPHEYLKEDNWTWETFTELARAATRDTDNDGVNDTWGLSGWAHDFSMFAVASNDARLVYTAEGKEGLSDPNTIAAYEWIRQLHFDDKVWYAVNHANDYQERGTFSEGNILFEAAWLWQQGSMGDVDLGFVPFPKGPNASGYWSANDAANVWFIPAGVKDADIVLRILEDIERAPDDGSEEYPGQNALEARFNHQEDIDAVRMVNTPDRMVIHMIRAFENTGWPLYDLTHHLIVEAKPTATVMEEFRQQAQAAIDALYETLSEDQIQ